MLGLLMTQLATAAHACPLIEAALASPVAEPTFASPSAPAQMATPCDGMDMGAAVDAGTLCVTHCESDSNAVNPASVDQPVHPTAGAYLVVDQVSSRIAVPWRAEPQLTRTTALPVFASSARLRI